MAGRYAIEQVAGFPQRIRNAEGKRTLCVDDCCDGELRGCTALANCLSQYRRIIVELNYTSNGCTDPCCDPARFNGTYLLEIGWTGVTAAVGWLTDDQGWGWGADGDGDWTHCNTGSVYYYAVGTTFHCTNNFETGDIEVAFYVFIIRAIEGGDTSVWELYSGILTQAEINALIDGGSFDINLSGDGSDFDEGNGTATIRFIGSPGCGPCVATPPTADFTVTREWPDGVNPIDACDPTEIPELSNEPSCYVTITDTSTPGTCALAEAWFFFPGISVQVPIGGSVNVLLNAEAACGEITGTPRYLVIDECGCTDTKTGEDITCCGCCAPTGGDVTVATDDSVSGDPGSSCDPPTGIPSSNPDCYTWDNQWCYHLWTFPDIDVGSCSFGGLFLVDWDGLEGRSGGSPPFCVYPGQEVRTRLGSGGLDAGCHCVKITPVNYEGCLGTPSYFELLKGDGLCIQQSAYDVLDPETPCYDAVIVYPDCPPSA